jgi:hypothetical protein
MIRVKEYMIHLESKKKHLLSKHLFASDYAKMCIELAPDINELEKVAKQLHQL